MPSRIRPELVSGDGRTPVLTNGTAYFAILNAVQAQDGLTHGRLHWRGKHCAIGSFFTVSKATLPWSIVDEVAAVNDSMPTLTSRQRKLRMVQWLRWKLKQIGMPGCERAKQPV